MPSMNPAILKAKRRRKTLRGRARANAYIHDYKASHPCVDCGETNPSVLDFDHVRGVKQFRIAHRAARSLSAIKTEIAKCVVRCKPCHQKQHKYWRILAGLDGAAFVE
jgi:hypothetical protein